VTDADAALGYLDPETFAEGRLRLDLAAAEAALERAVGAPLALSATEAAIGVSQIVDESMASAGRMHAVESGKDLGGRTMIAFGGNGPLHATRVARRAGVSRILIPRDPGVGSAVGFLHAPVSYEIVRSLYTTLDAFDAAAVEALFAEMSAQATTVVRAGAPAAALTVARAAFMRYRGQGHEIEIALPDRALNESDATKMVADFESEYARQFARAVPGMVIEVLNWAVSVSTPQPVPVQPPAPADARPAAPSAYRVIACEETGAPLEAAVFLRSRLAPGDVFSGPALVVEPQTTTLVANGWRAAVDGASNLILTHDAEAVL
jgi:N-methylhydantoinase A